MIHLARDVGVTSFDIQATVGVGRDRPEFLAVARLAADLGRPIGAQDLQQELLGPLPPVACRKVLERCMALGLLEPQDERSGLCVLSAAGLVALERNQVLVPEEGVWRFFLVSDPLVPAPLVHALRLETESAFDSRRNTKGPRSEQSAPRPSPALLKRCLEAAVPVPSLCDGRLLQPLEIAKQGTAGPAGKLRLELHWSEQACEVRLSGRLSTDQGSLKRGPLHLDERYAPPADAADGWSLEMLWRGLVSLATDVDEAEIEHWCQTTGMLVMPTEFGPLPDAARNSFRRDIDVPECELTGLGEFDPTTLKDVALVPRSDAVAQDWLEWLQWHGLNDYVTPAQIEERAGAFCRRFTHHRPRPRSPRELLAHALANRADERSRFLLAPADLGLWS